MAELQHPPYLKGGPQRAAFPVSVSDHPTVRSCGMVSSEDVPRAFAGYILP